MDICRLFHTVKHLRPIQVRYQLKYRLVKPGSLNRFDSCYSSGDITPLVFAKEVPVMTSFQSPGTFVFLNQAKTFPLGVDWNFQGYGKLWNYHLQYASFLGQDDLSAARGLELLRSLYTWLHRGRLTPEPYPASLRIINVIRWLSHTREDDSFILGSLHAELDFLSNRLEYHLLGNHLLENAFALFMGGAFFSNPRWEQRAVTILKKQLPKQILSDGAHYELSPAYHNVVLFRLLELTDWLGSLRPQQSSVLSLIRSKAALMLSWIDQMQFKNGDLPHFNDSSDDMAFPLSWLKDYAQRLDIVPSGPPLGSSGYRSFISDTYECKTDLAQLGPDFQPGHSHADALSFVLHYKDKPLLIERGTSTYQPGPVRNAERSTMAHNTVVVNSENQSQMWSQFRVGKRAHTTILTDTPDLLMAQHDGYKARGILHRRTFVFAPLELVIADELIGSRSNRGELHLHFHPGRKVTLKQNTLFIDQQAMVSFSANENIRVETFEMATGLNQYRTAKKIVVSFTRKLITKITLPS